MDLGDVMDELATRLDTIADLQVIAWPAQKIVPPTAIIDYPDFYSYDMTYGRGSDSMTIPVFVAVGRVWDQSTRDTLAQFANGSGAKSIKAVLESGSYTAFGECAVTQVEFAPIVFAAVEYFGAAFTVSITGSGS
jgi:hypothetical protein